MSHSYATGEFANVLIITPTVAGHTCTAGSCPEQEFIELVPEGGAALAYFFWLVFAASAPCSYDLGGKLAPFQLPRQSHPSLFTKQKACRTWHAFCLWTFVLVKVFQV